MLTKISIVTGVVLALIQGAVLFELFNPTNDQLAWLNGFVLLIGAAVHSWFNPSVPFGAAKAETG